MRETAEVRGRAMVRPFTVAQVVDTADAQAVRSAFAALTRTWGGMYMPIFDASLTTAELEHDGQVFDVDALYMDDSQGDIADWLRSSGWGWTGQGEWGPFASGQGLRRGLLPANLVRVEGAASLVPQWDKDDELGLFYTAVFGHNEANEETEGSLGLNVPGSMLVGLDQLKDLPHVTVESIGAVQATAQGVSVAERRYLDGLSGIVVARTGHPEDLVRFWNLRTYGRPILCLPENGPPQLLDLLTRGSLPGVTIAHGGPMPRKRQCLMVWGLDQATGTTRAAIDTMAKRLSLVPQEAMIGPTDLMHPGLETRFEARFRAEFTPTTQVTRVPVPTVPLVPTARIMPGVVAVQISIDKVSGLDPRSTAQLPPYRRHGKLLKTFIGTVDADQFRITGEGDGVVVGHQASRDEVPLGFPPHLEAIHALFDDDNLKSGQSDDGKFQTRAAEILGGPFGSLLTQPGVRAAIDKTAGTPTGLTLQQLQATVRSNRGMWPDSLLSSLTPQEYAVDVTNRLLFSGLFVPMLDVHCSNCRVESQVSPRDLDATIRCEFCGEDFRLALSLSLSRNKSKWRYRLASHLSPEKVKALLPALATMSLLGQLSATAGRGHPDVHAFGVTFTPRGLDPVEADIVAYLGRPTWATVLGEVKTSNRIDENDIRNLEGLQRRLDTKRSRSLLLFATLKDEFAPIEVKFLRELVERCTGTTTAHNAVVPRLPLVLTAKDLSLPWSHDDSPWHWNGTSDHADGLFSTAVESCRRNLGLLGMSPLLEEGRIMSGIEWDDRPTTGTRRTLPQ